MAWFPSLFSVLWTWAIECCPFSTPVNETTVPKGSSIYVYYLFVFWNEDFDFLLHLFIYSIIYINTDVGVVNHLDYNPIILLLIKLLNFRKVSEKLQNSTQNFHNLDTEFPYAVFQIFFINNLFYIFVIIIKSISTHYY